MIPKGSEKSPEFDKVMCLFGQIFRDKIFSIPGKDLPSQLNQLESISWINKLCNLVAMCMWCQKNDMTHAPYSLLRRMQIAKNDVEKIGELLSRYPQPDRIFSFSSKGVRIENSSLTNQLRIIINDLANEISEKKFNSALGDFFEKEYLAKYFNTDELKKCYRVHSGILAHEVPDKELKPDVDLIVEDLRREKFYFIQVKYLRIGGKAYTSGDLDHLVSGKLTKGLKQIIDAKTAMDKGKLRELLDKRGLINCVETNSIFMMVHNINNFDFCLRPSGIISYEWNSIRNLFKDGEVMYGHSTEALNAWRSTELLPIENPDELIKKLIEKSPASELGEANTLFDSDHLAVKFPIGHRQVICQGMGL
jgi:hypothetical protein